MEEKKAVFSSKTLKKNILEKKHILTIKKDLDPKLDRAQSFNTPKKDNMFKFMDKKFSFDQKNVSIHFDKLILNQDTKKKCENFFRETKGLIRMFCWEKYAFQRKNIYKQIELDQLRKELCDKKIKLADRQTIEAMKTMNELMKIEEKKSVQIGDIFYAIPSLKDLTISSLKTPVKDISDETITPEKTEKSLVTFGELQRELTGLLTQSKDIKLQFLIEGDKKNQREQKIFEKSLEKGSLNTIFNFRNLKEIFSITLNEIRKDPTIVEARYEEFLLLKTQILPTLKYNREQGMDRLRSYLKEKFLPPKFRYKVWIYILPDPCKFNITLFKGYSQFVNRNMKRIPNLQLIEAELESYCKSENWFDYSDKLVSSCVFVILTFQNCRPDIQYRDGMQKLVVFFYVQSFQEFETFKIFTNLLLTSYFFKNYYKGKSNKMFLQKQLFYYTVIEHKQNEKNFLVIFKKNLKLFEKFFFLNASNQFLDIFDNKIVEKIFDYFVVYGDCILYGITMFIFEEILIIAPNIKLENAGVKDLIKLSRIIEPAKIIVKILSLHHIKSDYEVIYKKVVPSK